MTEVESDFLSPTIFFRLGKSKSPKDADPLTDGQHDVIC
jgi:hypothetical protein